MILDTIVNRKYKEDLIGKTLSAKYDGQFVVVNFNGEERHVLASEVKIIKDKDTNKFKTNKTKVIKSINVYGEIRKLALVKEIIHYKTILRTRSNDELDSIKHVYNRLVDIYCLASKNLIDKGWEIKYILKNTIKEIADSDIELEPYNQEYIDYLIKWGLL